MAEVYPKSALNREGRTIAVGDIHGCSTALMTLIEAIAPSSDDVIVTLGDHINRGPDSRGVIEQLLALRERCKLIALLGNHEEMFLAVLQHRSNLDHWLRFGGDETLKSYGLEDLERFPRRHLTFIEGCRRFYETDSHVFVHAGYWPNLPMDQQPATALFWEHLQAEQAYPHYTGKTVVVGHTPQAGGEILDLGFVLCIDTNCCEGGWLTALDVATGRCWQTNERGEQRQGRSRNRRP